MLNFPNASPEEEKTGTTAATPASPASVKAATASTKPTHAVLYTDGGSRPPGVGGWGVHGYLFRDEPAKQGAGVSNAVPTRFGYKMKGSGLPDITLTHYIDAFGPILPTGTNNQAEILGAIKAFEFIQEHEIKNATLLLDSQYALNGITDWMHGWCRNNWTKGDGQTVPNANLWKRCHELKSELDNGGVEFKFQWVKGHNGDLGNHLADRCATRAVFVGRKGHDAEVVMVEDAKGYWGFKPERSRMLSHPNWYFAAGAVESYCSPDGRHVYYLGDPREEEELLGKKIAQATFSVVYLKQADPILNLIRDTVARMGGDQYQALSVGDLRTIFKPDVYEELQKHGDLLINCDAKNHRLTMWDHGEKTLKVESINANGEKVLRDETISSILSKDIRPARLAYRAIEALQSLERTLQEYLQPGEGTQVRLTDLTGLLYESDTSKKKPVLKLKGHITSALRSIDVDAGYATGDGGTGITKLRLTLSLDTPDRNTLAALAGEDTKVTLLTWPESPHAIRYAVVIEADGDVGIWSGIYANLHMLASKP